MDRLKVGVCIVTCGDRFHYLKECIETVRSDGLPHVIIIVNNGSLSCKDIDCKIFSGHGGNSPHGQNIGLHYLAEQDCDVVLKSDDDLKYEPDYLRRLVRIMEDNWEEKVAAVGAVCWSDSHSAIVHFVKRDNNWCTQQGNLMNSEQLGLYRVIDSPRLWLVRHLHGAFLYRVKDALELERRTKDIRGGAFGEYFSQIACREETEFTLLLNQFLNKKLIYDTLTIVYHQYAPGGTRRIYTDKLCLNDDKKMRDVCRKLGVKPILRPVWIKPYETMF